MVTDASAMAFDIFLILLRRPSPLFDFDRAAADLGLDERMSKRAYRKLMSEVLRKIEGRSRTGGVLGVRMEPEAERVRQGGLPHVPCRGGGERVPAVVVPQTFCCGSSRCTGKSRPRKQPR
jgi:hypothetical protein